MKGRLKWTSHDKDVVFVCETEGQCIDPAQWALAELVSEDGAPASAAPLLRLIEDELVTPESDDSLAVPNRLVAQFQTWECRSLGLPEKLPYSIEIQVQGTLLRPNSTVQWRFWQPEDGRAVIGEREGCFAHIGERQYIVPEPIYSLLEAIDAFGRENPQSLDDRLVALGEIKKHLPENASIHDQLRRIVIAFADSFTLEPLINELGEPDFHPVPGRLERIRHDQPDLSEGEEFIEVLVEARARQFAQQFRQWSHSRQQYAVGASTYLVLSEPLRQALGVVRRFQNETPTKRKAFIQHPHLFLKENLQHTLSDQVLNEVFFDEGYGERVRGIGFWHPKVLPWIKQSSEPWLPLEELGLRIGDDIVCIDAADTGALLKRIQQAQEEGKGYIEYEGHRIPVSQETCDALAALQVQQPERPPRASDEPPTGEADKSERQVLIIKGNLEDLEYQYVPRKVATKVGKIPSALQPEKLLPHQLDALIWLQSHWVEGTQGALLADDMGLGKTLVALSFLAWLQDEMRDGTADRNPLLVVAPTGLLKNWIDEDEKHLDRPGLGDVIEAYGNGLRALRTGPGGPREDEMGIPLLDLALVEGAGWVLTTFETLRDYQFSFGKVHWAALVFDEAQKIKNPAARVTDAAKAMKADFVLALTGTPVENRLADLWCIVDAVQPGRLGSLKGFCNTYEPKTLDEGQDSGGITKLAELRDRLLVTTRPPVMLRRSKVDSLPGLPEKHTHQLKMTMPPAQAQEYSSAVARARLGDRKMAAILQALHAIRNISLHPFEPAGQDDEDYIAASARLQVAFNVLDQIAAKAEKALIFLESRRLQAPLAAMIQRRYQLAELPLIINGQVAGPKRTAHAKSFQERRGFDAMILSPRAGGVGLTITAANHVIHVSRWWNPAVEDQCTDRVFRIGQDQPVHVYYPMAVHPDYGEQSYDLRLHSLLERKRSLSRDLLAPTVMSTSETERLFDETVAQTSDYPGRAATTLDDIDCMEPLAFEDWVLAELQKAGFRVHPTPRTGDRGADLLAFAPVGSGEPNLIVQCKHTETTAKCSDAAVAAVLEAAQYYQVQEPRQFVVVTNAGGFSDRARHMAVGRSVTLIDRDGLLRLCQLHIAT